MKVAQLLETRRQKWRELEQICIDMEGRKARMQATVLTRFAALYRSACADLALADSYQLPPATVQYLHQLVARAHSQLYRSRRFNLRAWGEEMFVHLPQRLYNDKCLRLAFFLFWGIFLGSMFLASEHSPVPGFGRELLSDAGVTGLENMYENPIGRDDMDSNVLMGGFYIQHNTSIGLQVFASGLLFGIGGLVTTAFNAAMLGAAFGHMTRVPQWSNFSHFVTAHGPFELTAIVLSAAAGMRLGFALVDTRGLSRDASVRRAAIEAMPAMGAAMVLFFLAALIEGFISPSGLPYSAKAVVAIISSGLMMFYFVLLGLPRGGEDAAE